MSICFIFIMNFLSVASYGIFRFTRSNTIAPRSEGFSWDQVIYITFSGVSHIFVLIIYIDMCKLFLRYR